MDRLLKIFYHLHPNENTSSNNAHNKHKSTIGILGNADIGGNTEFEAHNLNRNYNTITYWEQRIDALEYVLLRKRVMSAHELRFGIESLPKDAYLNITYYEKWMYSILATTLRKGLYSETELNQKYLQYLQKHKPFKIQTNQPKFHVNDTVQVRDIFDPELGDSFWRLAINVPTKMHIRTPGYIQNKIGIIESYVGIYNCSELASLNISHNKCHLYRVRFKQSNIWDSKTHKFGDEDTIDIELMEHWLQNLKVSANHSHNIKNRKSIEQNAIAIEPSVSPYEILSKCVIELLVEKGVITMDEIRRQIEFFDSKIFENLGAKIVIKAWRDKEWKAQLLDNSQRNPYEIIRESFKGVPNDYYDTNLKVVENTETVHNIIVCTLCSCYPRQLLGRPPLWYKSLKYRSEIVYKPRELLKNEFGCVLGKDMVVRVHDSTSDLRYIVLPHLPSQIGKDWMDLSNAELEKKITRDMMIGVTR